MNEGMAAIKKEPSIPVEIDGLMKGLYSIQELVKQLDGRLTPVLHGKIEFNDDRGIVSSVEVGQHAPMHLQVIRMSSLCREIEEVVADILSRLEI